MKKLDKIVLFIVFTLLIGIIILMTIMFVQKGRIFVGRIVVKENVIEEKKVMSENILFLGDSITQGYDLDKYFSDHYHVQSGINGNKVRDVLDDMDNRVYRYNASKVFIMLGINDFVWEDTSSEEVVKQIKELCEKIENRNPYTEIYVESIFPYSNKWKDEYDGNARDEESVNNRIKETNKELKKLASEKDYKYIDIYSLLVNEDGKYNMDYTNDGLHPNEEGYKVVTKELTKYMK